MERDDLRIRILDSAADLFNSKGIKFTMDDLAHSLGMSKKTIYTVFPDKKSLMIDTIDRFFDAAMEDELKVAATPGAGPVEKLRLVLGTIPKRYEIYDLRKLYVLKEKYPMVYKHWKKRREEYWQGAESLLRQGMDEGLIRPVMIPVFRSMFQASIEQFFQKDILVKNDISYKDAVAEVAMILVDGIIAR
ncbi:MAG: TetR/AcrR family transcriptional regulator [Lachnospiraceae bacterium]|nr:TetR/AcrR family transcriptional regulator [Lachnospiraceae bacterium]